MKRRICRSVCFFIVFIFSIGTAESFDVPLNFNLYSEEPGVSLYRSNDGNHFVHVIELEKGGSVKLLYGQVDNINNIGTHPNFYKKTLKQFWDDFSNNYQNAFSVSNGATFDTLLNPTPLAHSLKSDGVKITQGYEGRWPEDVRLLVIWDNHVNIIDEPTAVDGYGNVVLPRVEFNNSDAPNILGGFTETVNADSRPYDNNTRRTFAGITDFREGYYRTLLILNSKTANQQFAGNTLRNFDADEIIMFDGGASTQMMDKNQELIPPGRLIPQAIGVLSASPIIDLNIESFNRSQDPIYADPNSDIFNPNFYTNLIIKNNGNYSTTIEKVYLEIYDASTGNYLWDMADAITGHAKYVENIVLAPGDVLNFGQAVSYFENSGIFRVTARAIINGVKYELASMNFQVLLSTNLIDAALIIDSSGSMSWNDPQNLRKEAAKIFVDTAQDNDQIVIVDFDSYAYARWSLQPLTDNRTGIKSAIDSINSSGGTNISRGLLEAYDELNSSTQPYKKAAVLLTDGQGSYYDEALLYSQRGWPIFTIGLGYSTDVNLLTKIANDTGGKYFALSDPNQLQNVYFEIATQITGGSILTNTSTNMTTGQNFNTSVTVPVNQQSTTFLTNWPGSDVSTTLISPSGQPIDSNTNDPDIYYAKGLTYELFRITNPEAGDWNINVYGVDLATGGEVVSVNVSTIGQPIPVDNTPPIINISNPVENKMYSNQLPVTFSFAVEDPESGIADQSALLNGIPINSNDAILLSQLGENTLTITATNQVNLTSELTIKFNVCDFQWLPPIKYEKESEVETATFVVQSKRTIPIKFTVEDNNGGFIVDQSVKVVVEGTTAQFIYGDTDTDVRINEFEDDGEPNYIVNLHTNFKKWDYGMESGNEYFINVYFDNILAGRTMIMIK